MPGLGPALDIEMRLDEGGAVALTFDDGPHPQGTPGARGPARARRNRDILSRREQVARRPALVAEIVAAGHGVEMHCHRHRNLLRLSPRAFLADAERARAAIEDAGGRAISDYRQPYGIYSAAGCGPCGARLAAGALVALGARLGAHVRRPSRSPVAQAPASRAGDIVLLHDADYYSAPGSWARTAAALPMILESRGRRAEDGLAAPLSGRGERPLVAAGEGFVEASRHRAPGRS